MVDFSKIYPGFITKEYVLSKISDYDIFSHYFGRFELKKAYKSVFRKDRTPSTGFYIGKKGDLRYGDFATGESLDCFAFVAKLFNLKYNQAINKIASDFGIIDGCSVTNSATALKVNEDINRVKEKTIIQFKVAKWNEENEAFWRKYDITREELIRNNVYPVKELYINKKKIFGKTLRYAFLVKNNEEEFVKIYSPYDERMKWVSNIPLSIPFGLDSLPRKSDTVIITKSCKDLIVLKKIFTDVIATQNESVSSLPEDLQEMLLTNYSKRIIFWDNDDTGVDNCKKFNEKGFGYFNIPKEYYKKYKIKDASDFVLYYGVDALCDLFKEKNII